MNAQAWVHRAAGAVICPSIVAGAVLLFAAPAHAAPKGLLEISAEGQKIEGDVTSRGHEGEIEFYGFHGGVQIPVDSNGQPTSRRRYTPVTVAKRVDRSSPQLQEAMGGNRQLAVTFRFYDEDASGRVRHFFTVRLIGARLVSIQREMSGDEGSGGSSRLMEKLSFVFQRIVLRDEVGRTEHQDRWVRRAPVPELLPPSLDGALAPARGPRCPA